MLALEKHSRQMAVEIPVPTKSGRQIRETISHVKVPECGGEVVGQSQSIGQSPQIAGMKTVPNRMRVRARDPAGVSAIDTLRETDISE